jgi:hypothetical protein
VTYETDPMGASLDRHITGNWGEDSVHTCPREGDEECMERMGELGDDRCCDDCPLPGEEVYPPGCDPMDRPGD